VCMRINDLISEIKAINVQLISLHQATARKHLAD
jgi:hypothetical protein